MRRRTVLGLPALGAAALLLDACGEEEPVPTSEGPGGSRGRISYGEDPSQFGELHLPEGDPRGVVVVIHGGFWRAQYDYTLGSPLAADLAAAGWAAWNLEYRRVGPGAGGGTPQTFDDVAAGIDKLADLDVPLGTVVTLGHSAGGHLGTWAAARGRYDAWAGGVSVTHVVSQAGVLDLRAAAEQDLGGGAVAALLGDEPVEERWDPMQQVPLDVPVWCVHGRDDTTVPVRQSQRYVAAATETGARAELLDVEGGHFEHLELDSEAWRRAREVLGSIA